MEAALAGRPRDNQGSGGGKWRNSSWKARRTATDNGRRSVLKRPSRESSTCLCDCSYCREEQVRGE